jgi:MarR family transcriptional regulator, organic hydroperoxide resistance regulator
MSTKRTPLDPAASVDQTVDRWSHFMRGLHTTKAGQSRPWAEVQVTLPQLRVLGLLAGRPDAHSVGMSGRELAARLGVGPSAVTPLVDRLVEHDLVRREEDRADRRITRLLVTDQGQALLERMFAGQRELIASVLRHLDPDELVVVDRAFGLLQDGLQRATDTSTTTASDLLAVTASAGASHGTRPAEQS